MDITEIDTLDDKTFNWVVDITKLDEIQTLKYATGTLKLHLTEGMDTATAFDLMKRMNVPEAEISKLKQLAIDFEKWAETEAGKTFLSTYRELPDGGSFSFQEAQLEAMTTHERDEAEAKAIAEAEATGAKKLAFYKALLQAFFDWRKKKLKP
jgi:hypothetical protein